MSGLVLVVVVEGNGLCLCGCLFRCLCALMCVKDKTKRPIMVMVKLLD